ncbi:MAG: methyltransferase domain-containing protein [Pseudomonadota bacterium]
MTIATQFIPLRRGSIRPPSKSASRLAPCPFDVLVQAVPENAEILDIGRGAGLFLSLLAMAGKLRDEGSAASEGEGGARAETIARAAELEASLSVHPADIGDPWPEQAFDVISMVDAMHTVAPLQRPALYGAVAQRLRSGGLFVYRDVVGPPPLRAVGVKLHDMARKRDPIAYEPIDAVEEALSSRGFDVIAARGEAHLWYGHELRVFRKG